LPGGKVGAKAAELEYRIRGRTYRELRPRLERAGIRVLSLHNFCSLPETAPAASGDAFRFTSDGPEERLLAVRATVNTLREAAEIGARAVVLHFGYVPLQEEVGEFTAMWRSSPGETGELKGARERLAEMRREKASLYLARMLASIPGEALKVVEVADGGDVARFRKGLAHLRRLLRGRKEPCDEGLAVWGDPKTGCFLLARLAGFDDLRQELLPRLANKPGEGRLEAH
jgi:sugar phosphate isomerase/epimerase